VQRDARAPDRAPSLWRIGPAHGGSVVENADLVLAELPYFLGGWPIQWAGEAARVKSDIAVRAGSGGEISIVGPGDAVEAYGNAFDAANGLAGALVSALVARDAGLVCAHAGAAKVRGGLVVVLGASFAGKSSVALHLAAAGHRLFGDDRLAIRTADARGLCLGLMPKVRLPLPDDAGARFREFVAAYTELESGGAAYLKPWSAETARFGDEAAIGALVLLERGSGAKTALVRATRPEIVRALVENVHAPHLRAQDLLERLAALAAAVPAYRLRFRSSRLAAQRLAALSGGEAGPDG
jgi:hypothetical protein